MEPRSDLPAYSPDECDWTGCDRQPKEMVQYEDPEDYVFYCGSCAAEALQRVGPGVDSVRL